MIWIFCHFMFRDTFHFYTISVSYSETLKKTIHHFHKTTHSKYIHPSGNTSVRKLIWCRSSTKSNYIWSASIVLISLKTMIVSLMHLIYFIVVRLNVLRKKIRNFMSSRICPQIWLKWVEIYAKLPSLNTSFKILVRDKYTVIQSTPTSLTAISNQLPR